MKRERKIILVTGGAGFIGSNLCHYLTKQNFKVLCLDNFDDFYSEEIKLNNIKSLLNDNSFELIKGDIRDSELLNSIFKNNKIETVIHLAAKAGVRNSIINPKEYFDINVNGSIALLEAMRNYSVKNLVFASSSSVYGNKSGKLQETDVCDEQISPYAVSKKTVELLNYSYHVNFKMNVINLRLFSVYGKNQRPDLVIHKFFNHISQNKLIEIYGNGEAKRDFTYIDNVVEAFYNSVLYFEKQKQNVYEIINIGNDKPISLLLLLDYIKEIIQTEKIQFVTKDIVKGDVDTTHADIEKAKKLISYNPSISLDKGLKLFYEWFKNKKNMTTETLKDFIAIQTIANDEEANQSGIEFVKSILKPLGFEFTTEGESPYQQPVIVARYTNEKSDKKVVLYGHYDVEKIKAWEKWNTPPFELIEKEGRYYCRGIADNKAVLLSRLIAVKEMFELGEQLPNILWIIQGEEEVGGQTPFEVIPKHFADFGSKIYLEETGVHKKDRTPVIFHLPKTETPPLFLESLNNAIYSGKAILENRHLNKFSKCPFLHNIPENGYYIGFGPNDGLCNIHKDNESLDKQHLEQHKDVFKNFIRWVNLTTIN